MNAVLFGTVGLLCLITCLFVALSTGQVLIITKAQAVSVVPASDSYTPKQYVEARIRHTAWAPVDN